MRRATFCDPRIPALAGALKCHRYEAVGLAECLRHWCAAHSPLDGRIPTAHASAAAQWLGWPGEPDRLFAGLAASGWVVVSDAGEVQVVAWPDLADASARVAIRRAGRAPTVAPMRPQEVSRGAGFAAFWAAYPRHQARSRAVEIWSRMHLDKHLDAILAGVNQQKTSKQWTDGYIPHAGTWLAAKRWLDEPFSATAATAAVPITAFTDEQRAEYRAQRAASGS